jgi:hypothetical protein
MKSANFLGKKPETSRTTAIQKLTPFLLVETFLKKQFIFCVELSWRGWLCAEAIFYIASKAEVDP